MSFLALRRHGLWLALVIVALDVLIGARLIAWELEHLVPLVKP